MGFEQATIKVVERSVEFGELKGAIERVFSADRTNVYLKALAGRGLRVRDFDGILAANLIDLGAGSKSGTARSIYEGVAGFGQGADTGVLPVEGGRSRNWLCERSFTSCISTLGETFK